jgi:hypothetical protein
MSISLEFSINPSTCCVAYCIVFMPMLAFSQLSCNCIRISALRCIGMHKNLLMVSFSKPVCSQGNVWLGLFCNLPCCICFAVLSSYALLHLKAQESSLHHMRGKIQIGGRCLQSYTLLAHKPARARQTPAAMPQEDLLWWNSIHLTLSPYKACSDVSA